MKMKHPPLCSVCLWSRCQGQSFFDQLCSFNLFLGYTLGGPEWVSCQHNKSRFREDELTLIQLEIDSCPRYHQLFWGKGTVLDVLYMTFIVFKPRLRNMEMIKNEATKKKSFQFQSQALFRGDAAGLCEIFQFHQHDKIFSHQLYFSACNVFTCRWNTQMQFFSIVWTGERMGENIITL